MTDYLEEALAGLDGLVRRLRRLSPPPTKAEENVENIPVTQRKTGNIRGKNRNVSIIEKVVDEQKNIIDQTTNKVYNLNRSKRPPPRPDGSGDGGGPGAGPRPAEPGEAPSRQEGGREAAFLPPFIPEAGWIAGGGRPPWMSSGETGPSGAREPVGMEWAERADRAFRRDSRRYDGGFYLY